MYISVGGIVVDVAVVIAVVKRVWEKVDERRGKEGREESFMGERKVLPSIFCTIKSYSCFKSMMG